MAEKLRTLAPLAGAQEAQVRAWGSPTREAEVEVQEEGRIVQRKARSHGPAGSGHLEAEPKAVRGVAPSVQEKSRICERSMSTTDRSKHSYRSRALC